MVFIVHGSSHLGPGSVWLDIPSCRQFRLEHIIRVAQAIGQLDVVAKVLVLPSQLLANNIVLFPRLHFIRGLFFIFCAFKIAIVQSVCHSKLAFAKIELSKYGLVTINGSKRVCQVSTNVITANGMFYNDVYHIGHALAISRSRIVDIVNLLHSLHVKCKQILF